MFEARGGKAISKSCFLIKLPEGTKAIPPSPDSLLLKFVLAKTSSFCSYGKFLNLPRFFGFKSLHSSRYNLLIYYLACLHCWKICEIFYCFFLNDAFSHLATFALFYWKFFKNHTKFRRKRWGAAPPDYLQIRPSMIFEYPNCIATFVMLLSTKFGLFNI